MKNISPPANTLALMNLTFLMMWFTACGNIEPDSGDHNFDPYRIDVGHETNSVLIIDENFNGFLDILLTGAGNLTILSGNGSGEFKLDRRIPAGDNPVDLAAGDLDNDGLPDLVIANHETNYVTLLFGAKDGFSSERSRKLTIDVSPHPHAVVLSDINEDTYLDILVDNRDQQSLKFFPGRGDGTFRQSESILVGGDPYRGMFVVDVNGDGHQDVVTPNPGSVAIQYGNGKGAFSPGPQLADASLSPFNATVADFNGDGIQDIAAGSGEEPGRLVVWYGKNDGSFKQTQEATFLIADGPTKLNTKDINGDGLNDILVSSYTGSEVAMVLGGRDELELVRIKLDGNPWDIAVQDLNGDERMDLVVANWGSNYITVLLGEEGERARSEDQ